MKNIMKYIKDFIFGVRTQGECVKPPKFKTCVPKDKPQFQDWCKEFRVSMMYDRKAIHL
jgi:hypothetical protein